MGRKVPPPPGDTAPPPLKFQKSSAPENILLQNSPAPPLISGSGGGWGHTLIRTSLQSFRTTVVLIWGYISFSKSRDYMMTTSIKHQISLNELKF